MNRVFMLACLAPLFGACASIVEGTDQQVIVNTSPEGARCELTRDGQQIAIADPTPQTLTLSKSKNDVTIACTKAGYNDASAILDSEFESMTLGNLLIGGVIGVGVDAATGALNEYDSQITIPLAPAITPPPAPGPDTIPPSGQNPLPQTVPTS